MSALFVVVGSLVSQAADAWAAGDDDTAQRLTAAVWALTAGIPVVDQDAPIDPQQRRQPR